MTANKALVKIVAEMRRCLERVTDLSIELDGDARSAALGVQYDLEENIEWMEGMGIR